MSARRVHVILAATAVCWFSSAALLRGEDGGERELRDGFESLRPGWRQEQTDAAINLMAHERSKRAAHSGEYAERFQFVAGNGSAFFYSYPLPKLPVTDALRVGLFVRSNRAGVRLSGRIVLPADTDPDTGQASFVLVPGTGYENADRWQRLELSNLRPSIERQARVLRAATRRPVSLEGAYLERLVVNLFGGEGETEVFLDDLTVAPVPAQAVASRELPPRPVPEVPAAKAARRPPTGGRVRLDSNRLRKLADDGRFYDWFFTAIQAPGCDVGKLRHAGFDVLAEDVDADRGRIEEAIKRGFLLMPNLDATLEGRPIDPERMITAAASYPFRHEVAFWNLGDRLGRARDLPSRDAERKRIEAVVTRFRDLPDDVSRLTTAGVDGELPLYAKRPKNISILGIRPNAWGSMFEPIETYQFLTQRRALTAEKNPEGLFLAWLPATPPASIPTAIWGQDVPPPWGVPQVQPEQLRLLTYTALGAGFRGIGFRGDADLTRAAGRPLQIEMALLNEEIDLCESILANSEDPIPLYHTYLPDPSMMPQPGARVNQRVQPIKEMPPNPSIRAAAIATRDGKGLLLLVADYAGGAQFQPSQMALNNLKITVPSPESAQAFEISPGDVHSLERERVPGGTRITVPDFGTTALVLVTTDFALAERVQTAIARVRPLAVQMAIEQAELKYQRVTEITGRLMADGHRIYNPTDPTNPPLPAGQSEPNEEVELPQKAEEAIKAAREALEREDYPLAWSEARRSCRTLSHLMHIQWSKGLEAMSKVLDPPEPKPPVVRRGRMSQKELIAQEERKLKRTKVLLSPVCSPPLVNYNTLPLHYYWVHWMSQPFSPNLIASGSFDDLAALEADGWINQSYQYYGITSKVSSVSQIEMEEKETRHKSDQEKARETEKERQKEREELEERNRDPHRASNRLLRLTVEPTDKAKLDELPPIFDFPAAAIRSPAIRIDRDQLYRITVMVKKINPSAPGGGLVVTDSIGGEPLQFRSAGSFPKLSKVVLYRRAPSKGVLTVTLGLAGFGEAYVDDFKVERLVDSTRGVTDDLAGRPGSPPATATRSAAPFRSNR